MRNIPLKKKLGQCFLRDESIAYHIARFIDPDLPVLEIGCGDGFYTKALLDTGHQVIGVEVDREWIGALKRRVGGLKNFKLLVQDALKLDWEQLYQDYGPLQVTGNLPYHLTSPLLFILFDQARQEPQKVTKAVLMVQREVAERLAAKPGNRQYGALTLMAQFHGSIHYHLTIPTNAFFPRPKVQGGVVEIQFRPPDALPPVDWGIFRRLVRACFSQRRKMMRNAIRVLNDIPYEWRHISHQEEASGVESSFDWRRRPEELTFKEFVLLAQQLQVSRAQSKV